MKRSPLNLSEELNRMKRLMDFTISEHSHDALSEQSSTVGGGGAVSGNIGFGSTKKPKDEKASQEDISKLGMDAFAEDIKFVANKKPPYLKISDGIAEKISEAIITKAQVDGSPMNEVFKTGLLNGSLKFKKTPNLENIKVTALGKTINPENNVLGISIAGGEGTTESPEIPLYDVNNDILFSDKNPQEISSWVLNENIESFKKGEQQYYLITFGKKRGEDVPTQSGFFMAVKGDVPLNGIVTVGVSSQESKEGVVTPGEPSVKKVPVELAVEMGESFETDVSNFNDPKAARNMLLTKIKEELNKKGFSNLDISDISVISSASNYYGKVVDFTHDKSGNSVKSGINFNQQPTKTNDGNVDNNNSLAWRRGLRILGLLKEVNGTDLGGDLGKVNILDSPTEKVEWRVTDTDGKPGIETGGQYAKIFIKGSAVRFDRETKPPTVTPGENKGVLRQSIIYVDSSSLEGGREIATWFRLSRSKYVKDGKFIRTPKDSGTFSGLPKWLYKIIYSNN